MAVTRTGCAGVFALDRFANRGRGGTLLVAFFAGRDSEYRERILHHEAGHFLVAHLLDIPITGYTLSAWEAFRANLPGLGGVMFDTAEIETALNEKALTKQQINRYCIVWMAGVAAETQTYGSAEGGEDDRAKLRFLWEQTPAPRTPVDTQARWAQLQAQSMLEKQSDAYEALVSAMRDRAPTDECRQRINEQKVE